MSKTLEQVGELAAHGEVRVSLHGYEELAADGIYVRDVVGGLARLAWSKTILSTRRGRAFWYWNKITMVGQST